MTLNINVETKNIIKVFALATLFTIGVFAVAKMYDAIVLVFTSLFFALALNPAVSFLSKYMPKKKRGPAVAIVMVVAFALLSVLVFSIISPIAREASAFADSVPQRIEEIRNRENKLGKVIERYNLQDDIEEVVSNTKGLVENFAKTAVTRAGQFGNNIITSVTGAVMTVLMLLNGPQLIKGFADSVYRDQKLRKRHEDVGQKMYGVVTGYVNGQVFVALVASLFALGAMFLLRIPYPLPLASIVFVFGLIPLIGNTMAAIIVVLFTLVLKDTTSALFLTGFFILYQQIENATLQPLIQGRTTQLPTLVIFVSVILGVALLGPIGGLFAIPVAGCIKVLASDYLEHREDHITSTDSPASLLKKVKRKIASAA